MASLLRSRFRVSGTDRYHIEHPFWTGKKKPVFGAIATSFMLLQILFLAAMLWLHGSLYESTSKVHNVKVLMVDYDQSFVGLSLRAAAKQLQSPSFPTVQEAELSAYPTSDTIRQAVFDGHYWAAIYSNPGATTRLAAALQGGTAASSYDARGAITWVWNEVRYPAFEAGVVQSNMQQLVAGAAVAYARNYGPGGVRLVNSTDSAAIQALLNPIRANNINIQVLGQGARVFYNTVSMVMPIIMQFFFIMALNGVVVEHQLHSHLPVVDSFLIRFAVSTSFDFIGSLCIAGYIWTYREVWRPSGVQFVLTWMILWLYMHINFNFLDAATTFVPPAYAPFVVLPWAIINVTSSIFPLQVSPGFYKLGYALPTFETWQVLVQIWSGGANDRLYRSLPILFSWEVIALAAAFAATQYRCSQATAQSRAIVQEGEVVKGKDDG